MVSYHNKPIKWRLDSDSTFLYIANVTNYNYGNNLLYKVPESRVVPK